jgi:hypothetical protein
VGLNITVMSYAGAMGFGFTTARCAVPDAGELSVALIESLDELVAKSSSAPRRKAVSRPAAVKREKLEKASRPRAR